MTKLDAALAALDALGTDEAAGARASMLMTRKHDASVDAVEATRALFAAKAEQYRGYTGTSAARRAASYQAVADALIGLPGDVEPRLSVYTVDQAATGVVLFSGPARSEQHALDLMAQDAGYADYASIPEEIGGGDTLKVG